MSKFVKLLTSAYVNGVLRHPHEGALHLEDDEAKRLIDNAAAEDVSDGFTSAQAKEVPVESIEAAKSPAAQLADEGIDHQANLPPVTGEPTAKPKKETSK
ncbi:hypothetical protein M9978_16445 [Sphingomonas sp. MG17]|uniref:Uncharacterized protein n=1 Tax=Sphingomonas tagetis TaxID=2949092 RepID=A0A9X2HIV8_9SPHN|nr:hypothetical protein [Sphingomonas tagetis]MCP3732016.1 hypothetical protein [Sphingomonas tagetis]